ncbi:MAG: disulfide bond formation protein DsbA, partial [Alphaproteobacteria bacterium HGW-Alphaproteobacteria-5]
MTDQKEEYYQPWLRDPAPPEPARAEGEGLAKPAETPPVGIDLSRYAAEPAKARAPLVRPAQIKSGAAMLWTHVRGG